MKFRIMLISISVILALLTCLLAFFHSAWTPLAAYGFLISIPFGVVAML